MSDKIVLVGHPGPAHVGAHLNHAARAQGLQVRFLDVSSAYEASVFMAKWNWWLRGRRPSRLRPFSAQVVQACREFRPRWLLAAGMAPIHREALEAIRLLGIQRLNYLTDDPWNPVVRTHWFLEALPGYEQVFSPRRANLEDLHRSGIRRLVYLPFAYAPEAHFPQPPASPEERCRFDADVVFFGGADRDRLAWVRPLMKSGLQVHLYGGYWDRFPATRACAKGLADLETLRKAVAGARVTLCLVRRANRDGHAMRSFEIPAMRGCMLTEDTEEHRELFGPEGQAVVYFRTPSEMVEKLRRLLSNEQERTRLAAAAHQRITQGGDTYRDRLKTMLGLT